jgi:hypothetical protein
MGGPINDHNKKVHEILLREHPELRGKIRLNKESVTLLGIATLYWRTPGETPEKEANWILGELEDCLRRKRK